MIYLFIYFRSIITYALMQIIYFTSTFVLFSAYLQIFYVGRNAYFYLNQVY